MGRCITATLFCLVAAASAAAQPPLPPRDSIDGESAEAAAAKTGSKIGPASKVGGSPASEEATDEDASAARIRALIRRLDADQYRVRDDATKALVKAGTPALERLRRALVNAHSPEVRLRLTKIIEEIEIWGGEPSDLKLDEVLDRIPEIAKADWRASGYRDKRLEVLLTRWLSVLGQAADHKAVKLPVTFADVTPGTSETIVRNKLVVLDQDRQRISMADHSIIVSSGAVSFSHIRHCVVIARLGASISSCHDSVVIAGVAVNTSSVQNSVLISGSQLSAVHPRGSIIAAGEKVDSTFPSDTTFVNTVPERDVGRQGFRTLEIPRLILNDPDRRNPLADVVTLTYITSADDGLVLFRLSDGSGEYVARHGQPITHPDGREVAALSGWRLRYVAGRLAMFTKGDETSVLRMGN